MHHNTKQWTFCPLCNAMRSPASTYSTHVARSSTAMLYSKDFFLNKISMKLFSSMKIWQEKFICELLWLALSENNEKMCQKCAKFFLHEFLRYLAWNFLPYIENTEVCTSTTYVYKNLVIFPLNIFLDPFDIEVSKDV